MNGVAPPVEPEAYPARAIDGLAHASLRGLLAFLVMAAIGEAIGFLEWIAAGRGHTAGSFAKVGWLYLLSFHRVGIVASAPGLPLPFFGGEFAPVLPSAASLRPSVHAHAHLAFLSGTAVALVLLYRAGRGAADRAGGSPLRRAFHGSMIAPAYAVPIGVGSLAAYIRIPSLATTISPIRWEAFVFPLALAASAGVAGGSASAVERVVAPAGRRALAWAAGGWQMFWLALLFAFVGVLVMAGLRPDGTRAYVDTVDNLGWKEGAFVVGHHFLLLPNQSMFILTPAMGGCDVVTTRSGSEDELCFGRQPIAVFAARLGLGNTTPTRRMPPVYWLFVLAPAAATVLGGRRAARAFRGAERLMAGAGAGAIFAGLMSAGAILAAAGGAVGGPGPEVVGSFRFGPAVGQTALLALMWGVGGGVLGALLPGRQWPEEPRPTSV